MPWVLLSYRLPREPSTPRIAVWRKLRQVGAAQVVDGLVALPLDARTREHFDWLAQEIEEAAGEAWVWESTLASGQRERALVASMLDAVGEEYEALSATPRAIQSDGGAVDRRAVARLRRELRRVIARDYFGA